MVQRYNNKQLHSTGQLADFPRDTYLERTSRAVYSLVYLLPLIIFYEIGTLIINSPAGLSADVSQVRVVSFVWLENLLVYIGMTHKAALLFTPAVVILILLFLQIASRKSWKIFPRDFFVMTAECLVLTVPLIVFSLFFNSYLNPSSSSAQSALKLPGQSSVVCLASQSPSEAAPTDANSTDAAGTASAGSQNSLFAAIVIGIGAGIYEELFFRLILICLFMLFLENVLGLKYATAAVIAVGVSAILFSVHHHIIFINGGFEIIENFTWPKMIFRTFAGVYFAVVFAFRGFGIAAGSHAFYDIIAAVLNATMFSQFSQ